MAALAPTAAAQDAQPPGYRLSSEGFVTPLDPDAWRPAPKSIVVSPYGTDDIYISYKSSFCYQLDPAGNRHDMIYLNAFVPRLWVFDPLQRHGNRN